MATAECHFGSGLNSSSGGELKLYLGCTGSTFRRDRMTFHCQKVFLDLNLSYHTSLTMSL